MGGMTRLLLLLWAGVTVGSVVDLQKRIIGGHNCLKAERGYHAFLTITKGADNFICGGSLIHEQWILTAAHCWIPGGTITAVLGPHRKSLLSLLFKKTVKIELPPWIFEDKDDNTKQHDIMLLKLKKPTTIKPVLLPVPLPDCANKPKKGETVQIAGYYSSAQPGDKDVPGKVDTSKPLQCANIKVVDCDASSKCQAVDYPYTHSFKQLLCFQDEKKKVDITGGDSGGGLVFNGKIYGVIVTGYNDTCSGPAEAMDVCEYMDWIVTTTATTGIPRPRQRWGCFNKICH